MTKNWLYSYIFQHASPSWIIAWRKNETVSPSSCMLFRRELFLNEILTRFLNLSTCFLVANCSMTSNWLSFTFFNMLPRRVLLRDGKLTQFLHFPACFPIVTCFLTSNWLSFFIFLHVFPSWNVSRHQTDSVSKFSSILFRRDVSLDIKLTQFLHYPTWFSVVTCFITSYWLSFYACQCDSH